MGATLLGIDIGGAGCKAVLVSRQGRVLGKAQREYPMETPRPGWVEQDPERWWREVVEALRDLRGIAALDEVAAVGVSCTNALVAVDQRGQPVRPAILLWDQRTAGQIGRLEEAREEIRRITGNRPAPGTFSLPLMLWIRDEEPEAFGRVHRFLVPTGYLVHRLTGVYTMDPSRASTTLLFDLTRRTWSEPLRRAFAIPSRVLPPVLPSAAIAGRVTAEAATATGLRQGTPVVTGCMDTVAAALTLGAVAPGTAFIIMGTATRAGVVLDAPPADDRFLNASHALDDRWLSIAAMNGAGSSLHWLRDLYAARSYEEMIETASSVPPGAEGLVYLPYLAGERSPIWDPFARGVFCGVTLRHGRPQITRSVLEGVALAVRHNLELLERVRGLKPGALPIAGGGAKSALWCQIIADVIGRPLLRSPLVDAEAVGAAILAGLGCGLMDSLEAVARAWAEAAEEVRPRRELQRVYDRLFDVYQGVYEGTRAWFPVLASFAAP